MSEFVIVQELCESRGGRPGLSILTSLMVSVDLSNVEPCSRIGLSLSLICQPTSEDIKQHLKEMGGRVRERPVGELSDLVSK